MEPVILREPVQPDLFAAPSDSGPRRIALDSTSWLEHVPGWLDDPESLYTALAESLPWQQRERRMYEKMVIEPRLTAEIHDVRDAHPIVRESVERLATQYGVRYDSLWLNWYRDGNDSTAWHGDRISCRVENCIVPVLTLGASRRFLVKPRTGGASRSFWPKSGDLIVMGGRCQRDWVHAVPKQPEIPGPRISVNFQSSEQGRVTRRK